MSTSLMSLPVFDLPTASASGYILRWIAPRLGPVHLLAPFARKHPFDISLNSADLLIGTGHGWPSYFTGQGKRVVLLSTDNLPQVQDKVVVLVSCQTGRELGPSLVSKGARAFIGWDEDLHWLVDADKKRTPWSDGMAEPVMMPIVDCLNALLDGKPTGEAVETMRQSFTLYAEQAREDEDDLTESLIKWDMKHIILLGDGQVRTEAKPPLPFPLRLIPPPPLAVPISEN